MLIFVHCHFTPTWCSTVPVWTLKNLKELLVPAPHLHEHLLSILFVMKAQLSPLFRWNTFGC